MKYYYGINGRFGYEIIADNSHILNSINGIYGDLYSSEIPEKILFSVEIKEFDIPSDSCISIHNGVQIGKNFLYFEGKYHFFIKWKVCLTFDENSSIKILYYQKPFLNQPLSSMIIEPITHVLLTQQRFNSLHSLAFEYEKRGFLIIAPPRSGKSRLASILNDMGATILAEERNIIGRDNSILSYPAGIPLRMFNIVNNSKLSKILPTSLKVKVYLSELINIFWPGGMIVSPRISISELFSKTANSTKINSFFVLIPKEFPDACEIESISPEEATVAGVEMEKTLLSLYAFIDFFTAASFMSTKNSLENYWMNFQTSLNDNLRNVNCFRLVLNPGASDKNMKMAVRKILEHG